MIKKTSWLFLLLIVVVFSDALVYSQTNRTKTWYFGTEIILDFSSSPPKVSRGGNNISSYNAESSAMALDSSENLLFFATGQALFYIKNAKNGKVSLHDSTLSTTMDAAQGNLIFPRPGTKDQYYVCTVDAIDNSCGGTSEFGSKRGANFRTVSTLPGGKISVGKETGAWPNSAECQIGIPNDNKKDYWWIIHERGSADFKVFSVTHEGIKLSDTYKIGPEYGDCHFVSMMQVNNCCNKLAMIVNNQVSLFDFNCNTGVITNDRTWPVTAAYGLEFSPSGNYLFVAQGTQGGDPHDILQFDITSGVAATIETTYFNLGTTYGASGKSGHLQLGPDGQIYVAQQSAFAPGQNYPHYIGVISNPNSVPAVFNNKYIEVDDPMGRKQQVNMGLPSILKSFSDICAVPGDFVFPLNRK